MIGNKYGKWTVLTEVKGGYLCRCECNREKVKSKDSLINGRSTQCMPCYRKSSPMYLDGKERTY